MDVMMMLALYTHQQQQQHNGIKRLGHNEKERKKFERKEDDVSVKVRKTS